MEVLHSSSPNTTSSRDEEKLTKPRDDNYSHEHDNIDNEGWLQISDDDDSDADDDDNSEEDGNDHRPTPLVLHQKSTASYCNRSYRFSDSGSILFDGFSHSVRCTGLRRHRGEEDDCSTNSQFSMEERLVYIRDIGRGACGIVSQVLDIVTWEIYALKKIQIRNRKDRRQFVQELTALYEYDELHGRGDDTTNLIGFVDAFTFSDGESVGLVLEYMDMGSLQILVDSGGCEDENMLSSITRQCLIAFDQLHRRDHIHRDLKPANVLMNSVGDIKIADFGLVKSLSKAITTTGLSNNDDLNPIASTSRHTTTFVGTLSYMSPERLLGKPYDYSSDIYSLGLTIMATALGRGSSSSGYWSLITDLENDDRQPPSLPRDDDRWSDELRDFLNLCLKKDPEERPTADKLIMHSFITSHSLDNNDVLQTTDASRHHVFESNINCAVEVERILDAVAAQAGEKLGRTSEYSFDEERCAKLASALRIDKGYVLELCHQIWK